MTNTIPKALGLVSCPVRQRREMTPGVPFPFRCSTILFASLTFPFSPSLTCFEEVLNRQQDLKQGHFFNISLAHYPVYWNTAVPTAAYLPTKPNPGFFFSFFYFALLEGTYKSPGYNLAVSAPGSRPHRNPKLPLAALRFLLSEYLEAANAYIY